MDCALVLWKPATPISVAARAAGPTPPIGLLDEAIRALEPGFRLDNLVALSPERALYQAWDRFLKRHVAIRVHLLPGTPGRAWFVRETETLGGPDPPPL